jgi:hypothetical protein
MIPDIGVRVPGAVREARCCHNCRYGFRCGHPDCDEWYCEYGAEKRPVAPCWREPFPHDPKDESVEEQAWDAWDAWSKDRYVFPWSVCEHWAARVEHTVHHGVMVAVQAHLEGRHKEHCLCHQNCKHFAPGTPDHCPIAQRNYAMDVELHLVTPVWECPNYEEDDGEG